MLTKIGQDEWVNLEAITRISPYNNGQNVAVWVADGTPTGYQVIVGTPDLDLVAELINTHQLNWPDRIRAREESQ
jgi:hypothetical protein